MLHIGRLVLEKCAAHTVFGHLAQCARKQSRGHVEKLHHIEHDPEKLAVNAPVTGLVLLDAVLQHQQQQQHPKAKHTASAGMVVLQTPQLDRGTDIDRLPSCVCS